MVSRVLVVSTWGNFRSYSPAYYSYVGLKSRVKCKSSSIALMHILNSDGEHDAKALIMLPHTLLEQDDIGSDLLNQQVIDYPVMADKIVEKAKEAVGEWLKSGDCEVPSDAVNRIDFAVVPAVMSVIKEVRG